MDSKDLKKKEDPFNFEGPYEFELNKINGNYPSYAGVYAFVTKDGKIHIDEKEEKGSDILKFGSTIRPLFKRMKDYYDLKQKRTITAQKFRHFRYFHCDKGLEVYFKKSDDPGAEENRLNELFRTKHGRKPLLESKDTKNLLESEFNKDKYYLWSIYNWFKKRKSLEEISELTKSFLEIGDEEWNQEEFEKKYGLKSLPKLNADPNED